MPLLKKQSSPMRRMKARVYRHYRRNHNVLYQRNHVDDDSTAPVPATETETDSKTEFDMTLTNAIQILHLNSEEIFLPNFPPSPNHEFEPAVDPLAPDSEEGSPDSVEILPSSSDETEEQEERKRAKKVTPKPKFYCDICFQPYSSEAYLTKHIRNRSKDAPIKCTQCPKKFCAVFDWTTHYNNTHRTNPLKCPHPGCFKSYQMEIQLKSHIRVHGICHSSLEFGGRDSRVNDATTHQKMNGTKKSRRGQKYPCRRTGCSKSFILKSNLRKHMAQKHSRGQRQAGLREFPDESSTVLTLLRPHPRKASRTCSFFQRPKKRNRISHPPLIDLEPEPESEPDASEFVKVEMEEEEDVNVLPKITLEAGVDSEWEIMGEFPTDQVQGEGEENNGMLMEDIKIVPDVNFFIV